MFCKVFKRARNVKKFCAKGKASIAIAVSRELYEVRIVDFRPHKLGNIRLLTELTHILVYLSRRTTFCRLTNVTTQRRTCLHIQELSRMLSMVISAVCCHKTLCNLSACIGDSNYLVLSRRHMGTSNCSGTFDGSFIKANALDPLIRFLQSLTVFSAMIVLRV